MKAPHMLGRTVLIIIILLLHLGLAAQEGNVPPWLVEKAAVYYAETRWPGSRVVSTTPYYALDGSLNAWAVQFVKAGCYYETEQELAVKAASDDLTRQTGTVVMAARYDLYPVLEIFDGPAPHIAFAPDVADLAGEKTGCDGSIARTCYLGPMFYLMIPSSTQEKSGMATFLVDPRDMKIVEKEATSRAPQSGRLRSTSGVKNKIRSEEVWNAIAREGQPPASRRKRSNEKPDHYVPGVPYYHQHRYDKNSCGPTACTVVMGYWDMHGYGNLIDNGWCMEDDGGQFPSGGGYYGMGHVGKAVYHMMECVDYSKDFGTYPWDMEEGIEAFCGWSRYANQSHLDAYEMYYFDWSDITKQIDASRPVIWNWWIDWYWVGSGHFATIVGCDNDHMLYVHVNWPGYYRFPGYFYEVDWDNVLGTDEWIITVKPTDEAYECIWSEDFESTWGPWQWHSEGANEAKWWATNWHAHEYTGDPYPPYGSLRSNFSAYCNGKEDRYSRSDNYKPNQSNALILGPFSTMNRTKGEILLYAANLVTDPDDRLGVLVSTDGVNYKGNWYGRIGGWTELTLDLASVPDLGSVLNKPKVWAAIWFKSDGDAVVGEGAYVDDVTIRVWPWDNTPLPAPKNLSATKNKTDYIRVTWDAVPGATHYRVWESAGGDKWYDADLRPWRTENFFEKKNALLERVYYFKVQAATGPAGTQESGYSNNGDGWRGSPAPVNLKASDGTKNWVDITWDYDSGMGTFFRVYRATSGAGPFTAISEWLYCNYNLSWLDEPPKEGVNYYYKVKSSLSKREDIATESNMDSGWEKIQPPRGIWASEGFPGLPVSCDYETGYFFRFYRSDHPEAVPDPISGWMDTHWSDNKVYFNDETALPGTTYYYRAKKSPTATGGRESGFTSYDSGWRTMPAPKNVQATDGTEVRKIRISWDAVAGAGYYSVYISDKQNGTKYPLSIWKANTSYDYVDGDPGKTYWFWVQAAKTYGGYMPGDFSSPDDGWANLPPPENVNADQNLYEDRIGVRWAIVNGAYGYNLYRSESAGGNPHLIKGYVKSTSYNDTSAEPGKLYYYWLKTIMTYTGGFRSSDFSLPATGIRKIHPPTNVMATDGTYDYMVRITWDAVPNIPYYKLYRAESLVGEKVEVSPMWTGRLYYEDYGVDAGKSYYYFVRGAFLSNGSWATDFSVPESGWKGFSKPFGFTASDGTNFDAVEINWSDMPGAKYFQIYRANRINGTPISITPWTEIQEAPGYYDTTASPGTLYWYWIRVAYDSIGERQSPLSDSDTGWRGVRKWTQNPNITDGIGQLSFKPSAQEGGAAIVDDFQCQDGLPIRKIVFWGSYDGYRPDTGGQVSPPTQRAVGFQLTWYACDESNPLLPKPGAVLAQETCNTFTEEWYLAQKKFLDQQNYAHIFYYECPLNSTWNQTLNQKYFLSVRAVIDTSQQYYTWQWWPTEQQWGIQAHQDMGQGFNPLSYPAGHRLQFQGMDMSFQIWTDHLPTPTPTPIPTRTTTATPTPTPTPTVSPTPTPFPKTEQPPNLENGFDIPSWNGKTVNGPVIADDFFCMDGIPIKTVRWWGSHIGYEKTTPAKVAPPEIKPTGFSVRFHTWDNGTPGTVISNVYTENFEVKWAGFAYDWQNAGEWEHEFEYICRLETPFAQVMGTQYFLSIQAVYATDNIPYPWGWMNSYMPWYDAAMKKDPGGAWTSLFYPAGHMLTGQQMSMAFSLLDYIPPAPTPTPQPTPTETPPPTPTPTPTPTPEETPQPTPTPSPTPNNMVWSQNYNGQDGLQSGSWYWDVAKGLKEAVSATVADDWQSTPGLSLIRITWWGAYEGWSETTQNEVAPPSGNPEKYRIALNDYQDGYPPKPAITEKSIVFAESFTETWERAIPKWDEDGKWIHVFRYEQELDVPLLFESQTRYFLSIVAAYKDVPVYPWGWMSSWQRWNAAAVQKKSGADWEELIWPAGHRLFPQSMDMAFQLTAAQQSTPTPTPTPWPSPTPTPTPTPTGRFASQPPNMTDGFDIGCWSEFKGVETAFVADDFEALQDSPITGIRWWGSYAGWRDTESSRVPPPLVTPVQYIISFHERLEPPAVGPGKLLSEDICRAPFESWYGAVPKKGEPGKFEHEFAYLGMLNNPFEPVAGNTYVLSIQAVFTTGTTHLDWGWLNSEENWGNPATHQWSSTDWTNLTWSAGHRLAGGPMNMAFEIWTGPAPDPVPQPVQLALTVFAQNGAVQKTPEEAHYNFGDSVQLQATPANGYFFTHWSGDLPDYYVPPAPFTSNPINIIMDTEKVLTAHFSPLAAALTLIINSEHGAAIRHPDYPAYPAGTKVTIGVKPDKGYCFTGWSGDVPSGAASQNPAEITMDVSRTITAQYEILTAARLREIIMSRSPGPGQDVNGDGRIDVADVIALLLPPR